MAGWTHQHKKRSDFPPTATGGSVPQTGFNIRTRQLNIRTSQYTFARRIIKVRLHKKYPMKLRLIIFLYGTVLAFGHTACRCFLDFHSLPPFSFQIRPAGMSVSRLSAAFSGGDKADRRDNPALDRLSRHSAPTARRHRRIERTRTSQPPIRQGF